MRRLPSRITEHVLIWLAVVTAVVAVGYRLGAVLLGQAPAAAESWAGLSAEDWITNAVLIWSLALLLAACFLWRSARAFQREFARIISSVSPDVLAVVTPDRKITLCNPAVKAMFGFEIDEVRGQTTDVLYLDRRTTGDPREIHHALQRHGFHVGGGTGRRKNGELFPLEIVTCSLDGRAGAVVLMRDITERRRAESEITRAKEELEASYRRLKELEALRDNLTDMVVHDIRHAASGVSISLDVLRRDLNGLASPQAMCHLAAAEGFTADVLNMARSLLDISRMESGRMPLNRTTVDLAVLADEAAAGLRAVAGCKGLRVVVSGEPVPVAADRDIIWRVIANLLANAVRFSPEGSSVEVHAAAVPDGARLEVRDDGPGVPAEYHGRIFEKFGRAEMQREGADHSTGLGLTFCKLAVEAHGGQIGVISPSPHAAHGRGSVFWITLPS